MVRSDQLKPPTVEELSTLRETEALHHSNMFRLQMEELLQEISIKEKSIVKLGRWKDSFASFIKSIGKSKQFQLNHREWIKENKLPVPLLMYTNMSWPEVSGAFQFLPPEDVTFIGSFASQLSTTNSPVVDIALVLPKEFMQHNDLMNCRWLLRRVLYLSWLGKALQNNTELVSNVSWTYHCGSQLRPILQVSPAGKLGEKWKINIFPIPPTDFFKISHISPLKGSVSLSWYFQKEKQQGDTSIPTPNYNWACGVDVVMLQNNKFITENLYQTNWIEGIKLLNLWLSQRYLNRGEGGITSHVMSLLVVYLIHNRKIVLQMSPYQVFRTVLLYITQSDWKKDGPSFTSKSTSDDFHPLYSLVFVDPTGHLNLLAPTFHQTFLEIQHESKKGLEMLELSFTTCFEALFIQKVEFYLNYDQIIKINLGEKKINKIFNEKVNNSEKMLLDYVGDKRLYVFNEIRSLLCKSFDGRLDSLGILKKESPIWNFDEEPPSLRKSLTVGLLINLSNGFSLITKGPSADSSEALEFREFWGEICAMRRFQDSTFHEAVLWGEAGDPVGDRRLIPGKIATYILNKNFNIPSSKISYIAGQLEDMIRLPTTLSNLKYGTGEESNAMVIIAFDKLAKKLRELELPIQITTIQSTSDVLKHTSVFPPVTRSVKKQKEQGSSGKNKDGCPLYIHCIDVQLLLEMSGKWPDEIIAIQAMKAEFHCKIAELLLKDGITAKVFSGFLQIIWEGYVFRIKVCYRREIYLLRFTNDDVSGEDECAETETEASIELEKEIEILPYLNSSLISIQSDFPSFSGSVRLIRRWASAQLLMPHLPPIVLELLVAYLFTNPFPYKIPCTPHVALLRFLHFMAVSDFKTTPVIVNFRKQFSGNDVREILKRFSDARSDYPPLFLCSPCEMRRLADDSNNLSEFEFHKRFRLLSCFTKFSPTITTLARIKSVASSALEFYTKNMYSNNMDFKILFNAPLEDYDAIIYLKTTELTRRRENINSKQPIDIRPCPQTSNELMLSAEYDPVQCYLRELRGGFSEQALFFHDEHGGSVIGVVWKPQSLLTKPAKINSLKGHMLSGEKKTMMQMANIEALIEDIECMGMGLVKEIKLKDK